MVGESSSAASPSADDIESSHHPNSGSSIICSLRQKGNPLLGYIKNTPKLFENILPDFLVGKFHAVIFTTMSYHRQKAKDLAPKAAAVAQKKYRLTILICQVDVDDCEAILADITQLCFAFNIVLFLAWSAPQAAFILESFKIFEDKSSDYLMPKLSALTNSERAVRALTSIPSIQTPDAKNLIHTFGTLKDVVLASESQLQSCRNIGSRKIGTLMRAFKDPYFQSDRKKRTSKSPMSPELTEDIEDE